jgi:5-methylthioadenosine/S-adenosylhomocysteine deaminase
VKKLQHVDLLIKNATVITMNEAREILYDCAIAITGDKISELGPTKDLESKYSSGKTIDAKGKFVFPGLINTHSHLFQVLLKGLGRDKVLLDWLDSSVRRAIWQIDEECVYYAALVGCIENIRSGATTVLDFMYCHGKAGLDDMVIKAFEDIGIRGILGRAYTNTATLPADCPCELNETEEMFFSEVERLAEKYKNHPRISIAIAPGIIWDVSEEGFKTIRSLADKHGLLITMHTVETEDDDEYCLANRGMRTIPYLEKIGLLGPDYISVHSVHMKPEDIKIFKDLDVKVSHNPVSNMILASGVAPVPEFLKQGITVSLATDGAASNDTQDMMEVLKTTALMHKLHTRDAAVVSADQVVEMATLGGAKTIGRAGELGSIEPGKKADLFIYNPVTAKSIPVADPVSTLIYSSGQANVETTIVNGQVILEDGKILKVDEREVLLKLQEVAASLRERTKLGNTQWGQRVQVGSLR